MKRVTLGKKSSRSRNSSNEAKQLYAVRLSTIALCIKNNSCDDLTIGKVYRIVRDREASEEDMLRVIDDSREDYLYPQNYFKKIRILSSDIHYISRKYI